MAWARGRWRFTSAHLWAFVHWLERRGQVEMGITRLVPRVLVQEVRRPVLSEKDLAAMVRVASDRGRPRRKGEPHIVEHAARNVAILRLLWATGLRRNEMALLDFEDVDLRERVVFVRHAKGKKVRAVPFDARAKEALLEYVVTVRGREPGPLFLARRGVRLSADALYQTVSKLAARAGVGEAGLHAFRRGFAVRVRRAGVDMDHLQTMLGHSTPVMSRLYSATGEEAAALEAYRRMVG